MERRVTILDIARESGFSKSAVAYVVNGTSAGRVSRENRDKIKATAAGLGYRPNLAAKRLRGNKSFTIGVLLPSPNETIFSMMVAEIQHLLTGTDYLATFAFWETEDEIEKATQYILSQGTDAIITVEPTYLPDNLKIPIVTYHNNDARFDYVGYDNQSAVDQALDHLEDLGHSRIAYSGPALFSRSACFKNSIKQRGLQHVSDELLWAKKEHKNMTTQGKKAFTKMLALSTPPTAILVHNDLVAFGMFQKAWEVGCKIPEDVSIIGFDDIPYAECSIPPLTTFQQSSERSIAGTLLDMIFTRMKAPEALKQEFIARPKLILRKSTTLAKSK